MNIAKNPAQLKSLFLASVLATAFSACGSKSSIDLQAPPAAPAPAVPKDQKPAPGSPSNPDDPGSNPEKPDQPVSNGPAVPRYRMLCERQSNTAPFGFLDTTSKSFDGTFILFLASYPNPDEVITREHSNIHVAANAITIPGAQGDTVDFFFIAQKDTAGGHLAAQHLFQIHADTLMRVGNAVDLGASPTLNKGARQAAESAGLIAANYGASDDGNFVLLPGSGGYKVMSRDRSRTYGTISADTANTVLPKLYESKKVFTALSYNGHGFTPVIKKLSFTSSTVSVSSTISVGSVNGSATSLQNYGSTSLAWAESASAASKSITIAKVDISTNRVTRATFTSNVPGAKVYPQMAVINEDGKGTLSVNIAIESLTANPPQDDSTVTTQKVNYAKIQKLTLNGASLDAGETIDYPASAINQVEAHGLRGGSTIVKTLFTTENQDELLGTFDSFNGYQIFKDRGGFLDGVSQSNCLHPQVVQENL